MLAAAVGAFLLAHDGYYKIVRDKECYYGDYSCISGVDGNINTRSRAMNNIVIIALHH